ncbi:uncharacterized protein FA14DRAFT_65810 [Meira miltonrushii]|uniref:Transcription factor IIIC subunit 5 HTH domain-containing protein n=1 Tax=Meira miltonrushii TaxID=1280837 RepID=A0A316V8R7_9BASI|nr:uncharacterized protein FA14DRAFT_65810 [Meira miltonrushii]PWN33852.1 hypothetical protein FA14DRAFT_65810 [Meira miltonrushii]
MTLPERKPVEYLGGRIVEVAPKATLPSTSFASIEFPAVLTDKPYPSSDHDQHPSLVKALESLSPLPVGYTSASSALKHYASFIGQDRERPLECKLAFACDSKTPTAAAHPRTTNALFRHALAGDVVDVHNVVCKIRKRTWRRKRKDGSIEERKEYTADAMGVTRTVARFRSMPDYVYDPGLMVDPPLKDELEVAPSLALHDYLRQMDVEGIRSFKFDLEKENYEINVNGHGPISNVRLPPPAVFDKTKYAHTYGFRQNPSSRLLPVGAPDENGRVQFRFVNRQKYRELAPIQFNLHDKAAKGKKVPSEPLTAVKERKLPDPALLEKIREAAQQRPMWSRRALFNQFTGEDQRLIRNQRQYISRIFFTITDGCWRDSLVRFGYDPRNDVESRFYQRMAFQKTHRLEADSDMDEDHAEERDNGNGSFERESRSPTQPRRARPSALPTANADSRSHIFDGVTSKPDAGTFMLIDIEDEIVKELIYAEGDEVIAKEVSLQSGWYTPAHYQKIHDVLEHRLTKLMRTGRQATRESCEAIIQR